MNKIINTICINMVCIIMCTSLSSAQTTIINSIKVIDTPNETRVIIKSNRKVRTLKAFLISGKNKIVIDIDGAVNKLRKKIKFKSKVVNQVRSSQFSLRPKKVRIVLDLTEKVFYTIEHDKSLVFVLKTEAMIISAQEDSIKNAMIVQDSIRKVDSLDQVAESESLIVIAESNKSGEIIKYAIMGGSGLLVMGGVAWFIISFRRRRRREDAAFEALLEKERDVPVPEKEEVILTDIDLDIEDDQPDESIDSDDFQKKFSGADGAPEGDLKDKIKELEGGKEEIDKDTLTGDVDTDDFEMVFEKDPNAAPEDSLDNITEETEETVEEESVAEEIQDEEIQDEEVVETMANVTPENQLEEGLDLDVELDLDDEQADIQKHQEQDAGLQDEPEVEAPQQENAAIEENIETEKTEALIPETTNAGETDTAEKGKETVSPSKSTLGVKPAELSEKIEVPAQPTTEQVNQVFSEVNQEEKELLQSMRDYQIKVAGYRKLMRERELRLDAFIKINTQINQDMIDIKRSLDESSNKLSSINEVEAELIKNSASNNATTENGSDNAPEITSKPTEIKMPVVNQEPKSPGDQISIKKSVKSKPPTPQEPETIDTHVGDQDIETPSLDVTLEEEPAKEPPKEPKYKKVYRLADAGRDVTEIAQELKMGKGQVELFLKLRDKGKSL